MGRRGESCKNTVFRGKRHDNKILTVQIVLSRNFVVIAQPLRRLSNNQCFLEGFLEGACKGFFSKDKVLRSVLGRERFIEGA